MWLFTQYGFYSVVCARDLSPTTANSPSGIAKDTLMVRARVRRHLEDLQKRFPELAGCEILTTLNTDYRFRLVVSKTDWVQVADQLAKEIDYGNFKSRVHTLTGDAEYMHALHEVWAVMEKLQRPENQTPD